MKTVSDIIAADILTAYRPQMPTLAIVDTEILPVEQILILKAVDNESVPENAFVVIANDGRRFLELDATSTKWNGTAMLIAPPHPAHITEAQFRFLVKNVLTSLTADGYSFSAVAHLVSNQLEKARIRGIGTPAPCHFCVPSEGARYMDYLRSVVTALQTEITNEATTPNS